MRKDDVLRTLRLNEEALRRDYHVKSLALFGSVARDEARASSDVDLLVEFDRPIGYFHLIKTQLHLQELLGATRVDLVLRRALHPELRGDILGEAINVA
jgi:uncharacterized protein